MTVPQCRATEMGEGGSKAFLYSQKTTMWGEEKKYGQRKETVTVFYGKSGGGEKTYDGGEEWKGLVSFIMTFLRGEGGGGGGGGGGFL